MSMRHSGTFVIALALATPVAAQGISPGPSAAPLIGPGPIGPGPVGPGPIGTGPIGPGPIGMGPVGMGPLGPGPIGPGPMGPGPQGPGPVGPMGLVGPLRLDLSHLADLRLPEIDLRLAEFELRMLEPELRLLEHDFRLLEGQDRDREAHLRDREAQVREREREREAALYSQAYEAMTDSRWDRALTYFNRVADLRGSKIDAALYWKAYAQNRLGQRAEALTTIAELAKNHPNSGYIKQARVLDVEVRRDMGQPVRPQDQTDEDLKLMALQALQHTAPEQAIPMIEKVLDGTATPRLKERALYVLAQSNSPRAREILRNVAKGGSSPELQSKAIQYLGVHGGSESRAVLGEIYAASNDVDVKKRILRAFMAAGEKDRVWKAAQGEQNPELRMEAVRQLGAMGAHEELWQLYQKESSIDVKRQILRAMFAGGNADRLIELARTEKNPDLRREAVRSLGQMGTRRTGDALLQIYATDRDVDVRKAVINALFTQDNATSLVALARKEDDLTMKKEIVQKLSQMRSKVATDYMIELLGK